MELTTPTTNPEPGIFTGAQLSPFSKKCPLHPPDVCYLTVWLTWA